MTETPETIWAWPLDTFNGKPFWDGYIQASLSSRDDTVKYRRADLPPKVKALGEAITVRTLFGSYLIEDQDYEYVLFFIPKFFKSRLGWQMLGAGEYGDMVNKRQDHYKTLVLSCLETTQ